MADRKRTLAIAIVNPGEKLLVIGCNGFVGNAVARLAEKSGFKVTGLSLHPPRDVDRLPKISYLVADIADIDSVSHALGSSQFDYVINCGGYVNHSTLFDEGKKQLDVHFYGLLNVIQCVNHPQLKGFVQIGSSDEYGDAPSPQHEELREAPISAYACAKTAGSQLIQMLHRTEDFPGVVARLFLAYGPGQSVERFIPQIISGCLSGNSFPVSEGKQLRDFCFVDDIGRALLTLAHSSETHGHIINVASGQPVSIKTMIRRIQDVIGCGHT